MSEILTETEESIAAFSESEIIEFFDHPIWKHVHQELFTRRDHLLGALVNGDIEYISRNEKGRQYRSNEALQGGLIEIDYALVAPKWVNDNAKNARAEIEYEENKKNEGEVNGS